MELRQWRVGPMANFAYAFGDGTATALVDPGFEGEQLVKRAEAELGAPVTHILATHGHQDHIRDIPAVKGLTRAPVYAHESADHPVDRPLRDGDTFEVGRIQVRVHHTPGHRFDSVCYEVDGTYLLTGDTLFVGECGRVDLPGSDPAAMHHTLLTRLAALPGSLVVAPGHDYGAKPMSTLEDERRTNYTLKPRSLDEFLRFMAEP